VVSLIDISYKREEREEREDWSSARASQGDAQSGSHDAERRIGTSLGAQAYIYLWAIIFHFTDISGYFPETHTKSGVIWSRNHNGKWLRRLKQETWLAGVLL
jgi:hypothetical protein